jgi:hypothetical protein
MSLVPIPEIIHGKIATILNKYNFQLALKQFLNELGIDTIFEHLLFRINPNIDILCDRKLFELLDCNINRRTNFSTKLVHLKKTLDKKQLKYIERYNNNCREIILSYDNFCELIMQMGGTRGMEFRKIFLKCKEILAAYLYYEHQCQQRMFIKDTNALHELLEMAHNERTKAEDERIKAEDERTKAENERNKAEERANQFQTFTKQCLEKLTESSNTLNVISKNQSIQPTRKSLQSCFAAYKLDEQLIYICRGQKNYITATAKKMKLKYPNIENIISFIPEANGINLFIRVKNFLLSKDLKITIKKNFIYLNKYFGITEFVNIVNYIHDEKMHAANKIKNDCVQLILANA